MVLRNVQKDFSLEQQRQEINLLAADVENLNITNETDPVFTASASFGIDVTDIANWSTAYGWGNHSGAGYVVTETDPVFSASPANDVTTLKITNWDIAHGWGDHSTVGYLTLSSISVGTPNTPSGNGSVIYNNTTGVFTYTPPNVLGSISVGTPNTPSANGAVTYNNTTGVFTYTPPDLSGYLTSETDPVYAASDAANVTNAKIANWDTAYGWGDHGAAGYSSGNHSHSYSINDLIDVDTTGLAAASILRYDLANTKWQISDDVDRAINELTDVSAGNPSTGQILKWDGTQWSLAADLQGVSGGGTDEILPVAFANVSGDSAGTGTGMTWDAYDNDNQSATYGEMDFTFGTALSDANYYVLSEREQYDTHSVRITNKTTTGFTATWLGNDGTTALAPSLFGGVLIVYASTPTKQVGGNVGISLTDLSVGAPNAASGNGAISYDNTAGVFKYTPAEVGSLDSLSDVSASSPSNGEVLKFDDTANGGLGSWIAAPDLTGGGSGGGLSLTDISVVKPNPSGSGSGDVTYNNGTGQFTYTPPDLSGYLTSEAIPADIVVDGDFAFSGLCATNGGGTYSVVTDNSADWNTAHGWGDHSTVGYLTLSSISIGSNNTPNAGGGLVYNNLNGEFTYTPPVLFSGSYDDLTNKPTIPTNIESLVDVNITSPGEGEILAWNPSIGNWENKSLGTVSDAVNGGITLTDLNNVLISTPQDGHGITWNNTTNRWENSLIIGSAGLVPGTGAVGQEDFTESGTHSWTCPANVTSVCVVAIGAGGGGDNGHGNTSGGGGGLGYINDYTVVPGSTYSVVVGAGGTAGQQDYTTKRGAPGEDSYFNSLTTVKGAGGSGFGQVTAAGFIGDGGGAGGASSIASMGNNNALGYDFPWAQGTGRIISDDTGNIYGITNQFYFRLNLDGSVAWQKSMPSKYTHSTGGSNRIAISPNGTYLAIMSAGGPLSAGAATPEEAVVSHINIATGDTYNHYVSSYSSGTVKKAFPRNLIVSNDGICNASGDIWIDGGTSPYWANEFWRSAINFGTESFLVSHGHNTSGMGGEFWYNMHANDTHIALCGRDSANSNPVQHQTYNWTKLERDTSTVVWSKTWQSGSGPTGSPSTQPNGVMGDGVCITSDGTVYGGYRHGGTNIATNLNASGIAAFNSANGNIDWSVIIKSTSSGFNDKFYIRELTTDNTYIYFLGKETTDQIPVIGALKISDKSIAWARTLKHSVNVSGSTNEWDVEATTISYNSTRDELDICGSYDDDVDSAQDKVFILSLPADGSGVGNYGNYIYESIAVTATTNSLTWYSGTPQLSNSYYTSIEVGASETDSTLLGSTDAHGLFTSQGEISFTEPGTYDWECPANVTSVCVVAVGGGSGGDNGWGLHSGGGGGLGWKNNITVTPGNSYTVVVGAGGVGASQDYSSGEGTAGENSYFNSLTTVKGGGGSDSGGDYVGDGGGNGGNGVTPIAVGGGGGGAGGYSGNGGDGGYTGAGSAGAGGGGGGGAKGVYGSTGSGSEEYAGKGGGVGINGEGASGAGGQDSTNNRDGQFGSGGGPQGGVEYGGGGPMGPQVELGQIFGRGGHNGGAGAVRIIWGANRSFPATLTSNQTINSGAGGTSAAGVGGSGAGGYSGSGGVGAKQNDSATAGSGGGGGGGLYGVYGTNSTVVQGAGGGGGVGIYGEGANGSAATTTGEGGGGGSSGSDGQSKSAGEGPGGLGGLYGGGGGLGAQEDVSGSIIGRSGSAGAKGAIRIVWGDGRSYPSTATSDQPVNSGSGGGLAITRESLSVGAPNAASGEGAISYDNTTGVFTYTPPEVSAFPAGTNMLFQQAAAPTGWTQQTSEGNNHALRVVTGAGGGSGGTVDFTSVFTSQFPTGTVGGSVDGHTLNTNQMPSHNHVAYTTDTATLANGNTKYLGDSNGVGGGTSSLNTGNKGGGSSHGHGLSATFSGSEMDFAVKYTDVIICTKN